MDDFPYDTDTDFAAEYVPPDDPFDFGSDAPPAPLRRLTKADVVARARNVFPGYEYRSVPIDVCQERLQRRRDGIGGRW